MNDIQPAADAVRRNVKSRVISPGVKSNEIYDHEVLLPAICYIYSEFFFQHSLPPHTRHASSGGSVV